LTDSVLDPLLAHVSWIRGRRPLRHVAAEGEVVIDDMEEYTINDSLRACGMPGDDDDDTTAGAEALFGSAVAPINVDDGANAVGRGDGVGGSATPTPTSMPSASSTDQAVFKRARSGAWRDFSSMAMVLSVAGSTNLMLLGESYAV